MIFPHQNLKTSKFRNFCITHLVLQSISSKESFAALTSDCIEIVSQCLISTNRTNFGLFDSCFCCCLVHLDSHWLLMRYYLSSGGHLTCEIRQVLPRNTPTFKTITPTIIKALTRKFHVAAKVNLDLLLDLLWYQIRPFLRHWSIDGV